MPLRQCLASLLRVPRSAVERQELRRAIYVGAWPLLAPLASGYRRTLAQRVRVVAVVGSLGKTTTARAVRAALDRPLGQPSRLNAGSGLAEATLRLRPTDRHSVIEAGIDGPGQMTGFARLLQPNLVVVTSIGSEHHRSLGS